MERIFRLVSAQPYVDYVKHGVVSASSLYEPNRLLPHLAIDGAINTFYHSANNVPNPWFQIEFSSPKEIVKVVITNRVNCCGERLKSVGIYVGKN